MSDIEVTEEMQKAVLQKISERAYKNKNVGIKHEGKSIVLPDDPGRMTERTAIQYLERKLEADEMTTRCRHEILSHPFEGAWALKKVLEKKFGWAETFVKKTQTMFGEKQEPPQTISLEVAHGVFEDVLWGYFKLPGLDNCEIKCSGTMTSKGLAFVIDGEIKAKHAEFVEEIANDVREFLKTNSIYKGQAIRLKCDKDGTLDIYNPPGFVDLSKVKQDELIFEEELTKQVETNLFAPIENTQTCRDHKIPLKRGVLLEGPYGTGKTLAAYVTADKAVKNGWTFIYLDRVSGLEKAIEFARRYEPCVIFAEDIDRIMDGERDVATDDVLNTIDGIQSKNSEIMVILTTNDVNNIEKAMLRPGRLDAVISFSPPDAEAAKRLVRLYARGLVGDDQDLTKSGQELEGTIPAVIREVVERSKLYAISRGDETLDRLDDEDIANAAQGMKRHLALLEVEEEAPSVEEQVGTSFGDLVGTKLMGAFNDERSKIAEEVRDMLQ